MILLLLLLPPLLPPPPKATRMFLTPTFKDIKVKATLVECMVVKVEGTLFLPLFFPLYGAPLLSRHARIPPLKPLLLNVLCKSLALH